MERYIKIPAEAIRYTSDGNSDGNTSKTPTHKNDRILDNTSIGPFKDREMQEIVISTMRPGDRAPVVTVPQELGNHD